MPKIKTHQKVGITNALKILVGLNGDKNFLPHHRVGAIEKGGDCYPGYSPLRSMSEALIDKANRNRHRRSYSLYKLLSSLLWKLSFPKEEQTMSAAWSGNDTAWRMVLDINLIALYGKGDGSLSNEQQRTIYSLCDGIVGGQGDGPLNPSPLPLGIIAFSNDSYLIDFIVGKIFRLDIEKIAILREALKYINTYDIYLNNDKIDLEDINSLSLDVELPPGWKDYVRR